MKIYIGPFRTWIGPHQIAEKILFWKDKYDDAVYNLGEKLAGPENSPSLLARLLKWIDKKKQRKIKIKIHEYDTWNLDETLAIIILPLLKKLKEEKHGSPHVDLTDVPKHLQYTSNKDSYSQMVFEFYEDNDAEDEHPNVHDRWSWVLDEIIWAFEQLQPDANWEDQYSSGEIDYKFVKIPGTNSSEMIRGDKHTYQVDYDAKNAHQDRITNGLRLFGKYYQALWD